MRSGIGAVLVLLCVAPLAFAQFQSCVYCDVQPLNPDPFEVAQCDTGTITVRGVGFVEPGTNGCTDIPAVTVRSTRPDRVEILDFQVVNDGRIRVDYRVPCDASEGIVGIDVKIDDNPNDQIEAYACGNARMIVVEQSLEVGFAEFAAIRTREGVRVTWSTLYEYDTMAFRINVRDRTGVVTTLPVLIPAFGVGSSYEYLDERQESRTGVSYQIQELEFDGEGTSTDWFSVENDKATGAARRRVRRER